MTSITMSAPAKNGAQVLLALGALGVVYGDIGTSPIYAFRESLHASGTGQTAWPVVAGCLSLMFWLVMIIVSVKYAGIILRADNKGQGGMLALVALALQKTVGEHKRQVLLILGVVGAALFFGDAVITPAISVLSAIEGLQVKAPALATYVKPLTLGIIAALFLVQSRGTQSVGSLFGPIMVLWFGTLAVLGLIEIARMPGILAALNPAYAWDFLLHHNPVIVFAVVGSALLAVTGGEALYADLGHFGRRPIRISWFAIVLPASALNYFGQGALILRDPTAAANPFFLLAPDWFLLPLILLSTLATVIASQAVISGTFSLGYQAMRLGLLPRMVIRHTSPDQAGQIYVPQLNWILMAAVIFLVTNFDSSGDLANAYGIAVTGTMLINTLIGSVVARSHWLWPVWQIAAIFGVIGLVEGTLLTSSLHKVFDGGWFPLALGAAVSSLMLAWLAGRNALVETRSQSALTDAEFLGALSVKRLQRVPGTAIFLTGDLTHVPSSLLHNMRHNRVLHEQVVLASITTEDVPFVADADRVTVTQIGDGFHRLVIRYGFAEEPDLPRALLLVKPSDLRLSPDEISYFAGRERILPRQRPHLPRWQRWLFIQMSNQETSIADHFRIPAGRIIELGQRTEL